MRDVVAIDAALVAARPQALAALLRYFRDLDTAEEAFQEACLRALDTWPRNGPPRDPVAWLIMVGRNRTIDGLRKRSRHDPLPDADVLVDPRHGEASLAEQLDGADYRDDLLRLLFVCCHPELPATQQVALALRVVAGLPLPQIARAFLVGESAMEQRITRSKARIAAADVPFETPGPAERAARLETVAAMLYLLFNAGYTGVPPGAAHDGRAFCEEAIRLARLLARLFPAEPEILGLLALMLLQHAREPARRRGDGEAVLLEDQDRALWNRPMIDEGLALVDAALCRRRPGPYQVQAAIAALHDRAPRFADTDWAEIDQLYATLESLEPSPVVTLNRAVVIERLQGPAAALARLEPLAARLDGYFYFHGVRGAMLQRCGRVAQAREAFNRAIALAGTPEEATRMRRYLDHLAAATG
ncbi:MAG: RNA polymerase sigma factor [Steroidobacteraceae bacterium]|jgi:RNA polymerase sigma-70 factor (ECF subfamily)|nr:RNA polymerase sigma factor [Steroidobacteraceae bacterium]